MMKIKRTPLILSAITSFALTNASQAALVSNWVTTGNNASGLGTGSPVIGDGVTDNDAGAARLYSTINGGTGYTLSNVGDSITLTGSVTFTGGAAANDSFRFGLFDVNGSSDLDGWLGYYVSSANNTANGVIRRRKPGNTAEFASTSGGAASGNLVGAGPGVPFGTASTAYSFSLELTRLASDELSVASSLINGSNNFADISGTFDTTGGANSFVFNEVAFLVTNGLDAEQASFSDIDVTFTAVPEPSTAILGAIGVLALMRRRRN